MTIHEANTKLGSLLRQFYATEGHTRAEAKKLALMTLTTSQKDALLEPIMDQFLRSLDAEKSAPSLAGRATVRAGNTSGLTDNRASVIKRATTMFAESKDKSFAVEVSSLRDVAKEALYIADGGKWVTWGEATFAELEQGRLYSEKQASGHHATARKINQVQALILQAKDSVDGEATLDKVIAFVDGTGDDFAVGALLEMEKELIAA